jgi:hypothetical protein
MIAALGQGHRPHCLFHDPSDVGLHRDIFEGGLYPELAMDLLRQIDMDLTPPDSRFRKSPHDSQYFCTERYCISRRLPIFRQSFDGLFGLRSLRNDADRHRSISTIEKLQAAMFDAIHER